jgi:hypothetical protein
LGERSKRLNKRKWREKWYHFFQNDTFFDEMIKMAKNLVSFLLINDQKMKFILKIKKGEGNGIIF